MGAVTIPTRRAILIAGPTASGKSAVAAAVAERLDGVVINADSMQVYRDLRVLTARPTDAEIARVPHRLFGHVDASEAYSVGRWLADVETVLDDCACTGQVPVFVGGTGLYLKALTSGLSPMPAVPTALRERLRAEAAALTAAELHARLAACDPAMAGRLRPTDPQRVLRALEVFEATGRSLSAFQDERERPLVPWSALVGVFLAPSRAALNAAIDKRFDAMMATGALAEVAHLVRRNLDGTLPAMRALGVSHLVSAVSDPSRLAEGVDAAKRATRSYAKRQFTFARHQLPDLAWTDPDRAVAEIESRWETSAGGLSD